MYPYHSILSEDIVRLPHALRYIATLTVASTAAVLVLAAPAHAAATSYVALGDSYSSGLGSGSYISSSGDCKRSTKAYSALWSAAHTSATYTSVACSGATTSTVLSSQVSALTSATTLVSITVGGNDVGFSNIMETCALQGTTACVNVVQQAENAVQSTLPGQLDTVFNAISSHAPSARVVVLDYPVFYQLGNPLCIGLTETSRAKINEGINLLDGVLSSAAGRHGFAFGDVRSLFAAGHQLCGSGTNWLHSLDFLDLNESYHPTADGQSGGYLPVFTSAAG